MPTINLVSTFLEARFTPLSVEGSSTLSGVIPSDVVTYSVPAGKKFYLTNVNVTADAESNFFVFIASAPKKLMKVSISERSKDGGFGPGWELALAGEQVVVRAVLDDPDSDPAVTTVIINGFLETV